MRNLSGRELWIIMLCLAAAFSAGYLMQFHLSESANLKEILPTIQAEKKETIDGIIHFQRVAQMPVLIASIVWIIVSLAFALTGTRARTAYQHTRMWSLAAIVLGVALGVAVFHFSAEILSAHSHPRYNPDYMAIIVVSVVILVAVLLFYFIGKKDRIDRACYLAGMAVIIVVGYAMVPVSRAPLSVWAVAVLMSILCAPLVVARLRDLGRPDWHYFLLLVPLYGFPYLGLCLIFKKGIAQSLNSSNVAVGSTDIYVDA